MNTNNNLYTVVYTTIIVVIVAAVLAFVSQSLKSRQDANEKAETISQMLTAGGFGSKAEFQAMGNAKVLETYGNEVAAAFTVDAAGAKVADLDIAAKGCRGVDETVIKRPQRSLGACVLRINGI